MATVVTIKAKKGDMFGGAGVAVFRPYRNKQSPSEINELTPEELLASAAEQSLMRLVSQNLSQNTDEQQIDKS